MLPTERLKTLSTFVLFVILYYVLVIIVVETQPEPVTKLKPIKNVELIKLKPVDKVEPKRDTSEVQPCPVSLAVKNIAKFEGFRATPYKDTVHYAIGFGQTISKDELHMKVTKNEAYTLLRIRILDLQKFIATKVEVELSPTQEAVLISFVYNVGKTNFTNSTLRKKLNDKAYDEVPNQLKRWVYATVATSDGSKVKKRLRGLENRRAAEATLWTV